LLIGNAELKQIIYQCPGIHKNLHRCFHSPKWANIVPNIIEACGNVLGAQARFSITQQLFISSDPEKSTCCMSTIFYYFKIKHKHS